MRVHACAYAMRGKVSVHVYVHVRVREKEIFTVLVEGLSDSLCACACACVGGCRSTMVGKLTDISELLRDCLLSFAEVFGSGRNL